MKERKILNSDDIKAAIEQGKALKLQAEKAAKKAEEEARRKATEDAIKVEASRQSYAQVLLESIPTEIIMAVSKDEKSFVLTCCKESEREREYNRLTEILKPKLEELGLACFENFSRETEVIRYDPYSDYEYILLKFNVKIPSIASGAPKETVPNLNPKCRDYDSTGRCERCAQFDCYECDWG